jgi:hypothetical protein
MKGEIFALVLSVLVVQVMAIYRIPPTVINAFGAKPPRYLIGNITRDYINQQPLLRFTVHPVYRPVDVPETVSSDGIEMLLRGFGDIAVSGRYIQGSDFTNRGCSAALVNADGSSNGPCNGRILQNIALCNNRIYFGVHPQNPISGITTAQLQTAVNAILNNQVLTWSQLFSSVSFPADIANQQVNILNGPPGGGIPISVQVATGVPINSIPAIPSSQISQIEATTKNWLTYFIYSSGPSSVAKAIAYNGKSVSASDYPIAHTFNMIIDVNSPYKSAVKNYLCYALNYNFNSNKYLLFPLTAAQKTAEKAKLGCPKVWKCL